jgi:poly(A) polymerase
MPLQDNLTAIDVIKLIKDLEPESFLVGGAVRDGLTKRPFPRDLDVAVKGDGLSIAAQVKKAAPRLTSLVPLDKRRGTARLVIRRGAGGFIDISPLKGDTIEADLGARDFTINAMAVRLTDFLETGLERVIDLTGARSDIEAGMVRACYPGAFKDDPVRILRAFRFQAVLGFEICGETMDLIPPSLSLLTATAQERIRDELISMLSAERSARSLEQMDRVGVLQALFPELSVMKGVEQNLYHHLDVWEHTLETVRRLEQIITEIGDRLGAAAGPARVYLTEEPVRDRPRKALLKLAAIFHDSGKPQCKSQEADGAIHFYGHQQVSREIFDRVAPRLRLATRESKLVGDWIEGHMRSGFLSSAEVSKRAVSRLLRAFGQDVIGLLLLFMADLEATRGPARLEENHELTMQRAASAIALFFDAQKAPLRRLLNGRDLMRLFGLTPGPLIGRILEKLSETQAAGEVRTWKEAVDAVRLWLSKERE